MKRSTMAALAEDHHYKRSGKLAKSTEANERSTVRKLVRWWDNQRPSRLPTSMTEAEFDDFLNGREGARIGTRGEVSNDSYNKQLGHLQPFIKRLIKQGATQALLDVLDDAERPNDGERDHTRLSLGQLQEAVLGAPNEWERWVMAFGTFSLGRVGELIRTKLSYFNLETRSIRWARPKVKDWSDGIPILGQLDDEYRLWRETYLELCPDIDGDAYAVPTRMYFGKAKIWRYYPGKSTTGRNVGIVVKRNVARALGVNESTLVNEAAHILRRSGARALYDALRDAGEHDPIRIVQAMLGHTKQATTEQYIGLRADRELRDRVLKGSKLLAWDTSNVVELKGVVGGGSA